MRCERCQGAGIIVNPALPIRPSDILADIMDGIPVTMPSIPIHLPCPGCGGCGVGHCCDGLAEQQGSDRK